FAVWPWSCTRVCLNPTHPTSKPFQIESDFSCVGCASIFGEVPFGYSNYTAGSGANRSYRLASGNFLDTALPDFICLGFLARNPQRQRWSTRVYDWPRNCTCGYPDCKQFVL